MLINILFRRRLIGFKLGQEREDSNIFQFGGGNGKTYFNLKGRKGLKKFQSVTPMQYLWNSQS